MQIGFGVPVSGSWATPENQLRIAARAEELGYASLWTFQRLLYPAQPSAGPWGEPYRSVLDPVATLGFLAARTSRIRLGVAVLNMPFFSPALLAKQLSTLDILSDGRLDAGLGIGWAREEYAASGVPYTARGRRAEEFFTALRTLLTDDPAEIAAGLYPLPPVHLAPRPVQRPHPPLLLGASAEPALRRAGRLADGWISASRADPATLGQAIGVVRAAAEAAGRDPRPLRFVCRAAARLGAPGSGERPLLHGSTEQVRGDLDRLAEQGMTEAFIDLNFDPAIGSPDADPARSMAVAEDALEAFAPRNAGT